jgi:glycopeptide antibiotics resistance protein
MCFWNGTGPGDVPLVQMPPDQVDVPALPILLPLGVVLMLASWVLLRRRDLLTARRLGTACLAGWYAVAVIGATLLPMHLAWGDGAGPPELYRITLIPLTTMRVDDFLLNIVMTLPVAALVYVVFAVREKSRVILVGFVISVAIEVTQGVLDIALHGNRWADVNDLISNTLGVLLGYLAFHRAMRFEAFRRVVESCALAGSESPSQKAIR